MDCECIEETLKPFRVLAGVTIGVLLVVAFYLGIKIFESFTNK
jgi:hypothetical protein